MGKYALLGYGISISAKAEKLSTEIFHLPHPHLRGCLPPGKTTFQNCFGKVCYLEPPNQQTLVKVEEFDSRASIRTSKSPVLLDMTREFRTHFFFQV